MSQKLCLNNTDIAVTDDGSDIEIYLEIDRNQVYLCKECKKELRPVLSQTRKNHFRHKIPNPKPMSEWHKEWQSRFEITEQTFICSNGTEARADALTNNGKTVVEFQHSRISEDEVVDREEQYKSLGKQLVWILDGTNVDIQPIRDGHDFYLVSFKYYYESISNDKKSFLKQFSIEWIYKNFKNVEYIYIDKDSKIYRIKPSKVTCDMIRVSESIDKDVFIDMLNRGVQWKSEMKDSYVPPTLRIKQRGAGCGKTYESIELIKKNDRYKNCFIYLSKLHSAKIVILDEFKTQFKGQYDCDDGKSPRLLNIKEPAKRFVIYTDTDGNKFRIDDNTDNTSIVIGTVDSFIHAVRDKELSHIGKDQFIKMAKSLTTHTQNIKKTINYCGSITLTPRTVIILDEAQDLNLDYINGIVQVSVITGIDIYVIGDKLQSLFERTNIMTQLLENEKENANIIVERDFGKNTVRRFHNPELKTFVNNVVGSSFDLYNLPYIENICTDEKCGYKHESIKPVVGNMPENIDTIVDIMDQLVTKYNYLPEDFMILFPIVSNPTLPDECDSKIQEYWRKKFTEDKKYISNVVKKHHFWKECTETSMFKRSYVAYLKSEEGQPINLLPSEYKTRIQSIHSAKGTGRLVVFVMNLSERILKYFRTEPKDYIYESLIHVALTRAKKHLYVFLSGENDDVYNRFNVSGDIPLMKQPKFPELKTNRCIGHKSADKIINKIYTTYEDGNLNTENLLNFFDDVRSTTSSPLVNWEDHILRYSMLYISFIFFAIPNCEEPNKENYYLSQSRVILDRISKANIKYCHKFKGYNRKLKEYWNSKKREPTLPMIYIQKGYMDYHKELKQIIESIQQKLAVFLDKFVYPELCPLELCVLTFLYHTENNGFKSQYKISQIYNIIYEYAKNQCLHGQKCKCDVIFDTEQDNNKNTLCAHYEQLTNIKNMYVEIKNLVCSEYKDETFRYNTNLSIYYEGSCSKSFTLTGLYNFAWSEKTVILFSFNPTISFVQEQELFTQSYMDTYFFQNCNPSIARIKGVEIDRLKGKKIITCYITIDKEHDSASYLMYQFKPCKTVFEDNLRYYLDEKCNDYNRYMFNFLKWWQKNQDKYTLEQIKNDAYQYYSDVLYERFEKKNGIKLEELAKRFKNDAIEKFFKEVKKIESDEEL